MNILLSLLGINFDSLWKAIVRPSKDLYKDEDLGIEKFEINDKFYKRTDFSLRNKRGLRLECSFWEPYDEEREYERLPCVVYLHGNSSSRTEAVPEVKYLLPLGITVFAFDFAGCGKSEGDYVSLGYFEKQDVAAVLGFLRRSKRVSRIGLWGRSMGAVTAILYSSSDPEVSAIVVDSAFASFRQLVMELAGDKAKLPSFAVNYVVEKVKDTIVEKVGFNFDDLEPKRFAPKCFTPAFFVHGKNDCFINPHHTKDIYNEYAGIKKILLVEGDHNSIRPKIFRKSAGLFFYEHLQVAGTPKINGFLRAKCEIKKKGNFKGNSISNSISISNNNIYRIFNGKTGISGIDKVINDIKANNNRESNINPRKTFVYKCVKEYPEAKTYQIKKQINDDHINNNNKEVNKKLMHFKTSERFLGNGFLRDSLESGFDNIKSPNKLEEEKEENKQYTEEKKKYIYYENEIKAKTNRKNMMQRIEYNKKPFEGNSNKKSINQDNCNTNIKNSYRLSYREPSMIGNINKGHFILKKVSSEIK